MSHDNKDYTADKEIFKRIFIDHWEGFKERHPGYNCKQYEVPIQKMLGCGDEFNGYSEYACFHCGKAHCIRNQLKAYSLMYNNY